MIDFISASAHVHARGYMYNAVHKQLHVHNDKQ